GRIARLFVERERRLEIAEIEKCVSLIREHPSDQVLIVKRARAGQGLLEVLSCLVGPAYLGENVRIAAEHLRHPKLILQFTQILQGLGLGAQRRTELALVSENDADAVRRQGDATFIANAPPE